MQASFGSSSTFLIIVVLSAFVVLGGAGSYFYCKKRNRRSETFTPEIGGSEGEGLLDEGDAKRGMNSRVGFFKKPKAEKNNDIFFAAPEGEEDIRDEENEEGIVPSKKTGGLFHFNKKNKRSGEIAEKDPLSVEMDEELEFRDEDNGEDMAPVKKKGGLFNFKKKKKQADSHAAENNPLGVDIGDQRGTGYSREHHDDDEDDEMS